MGRDRAFAIGLAVYGLGSLTTALSPNLPVLLIGWSLIEGLGAVDTGVGAVQETRYGLTKLGRDWAIEAMNQSQYFGPAPVSFEAFCARIRHQRIGG